MASTFPTSAAPLPPLPSCRAPSPLRYAITHNGLDTLVDRFMDSYEAFAGLPAELQWGDHPL